MRHPFPIPCGWFQIGHPPEWGPGEVRPAYYFDRHLVTWRDDEGTLHVQDAFCPHLGAHLGHGGTVDGCQIVCPFHGWTFNGDGTNTNIPYSERVNKREHIRSYPVVERNGLSLVWFHPAGAAPSYDIPTLPELDDSRWSEVVTRMATIKAPPQELSENGVDSAHFRYVHRTATVPVLQSYEYDGPVSTMRSTQEFPTPRGVVEGRIDVDNHGPGFSITRFAGIVDTVLMGCAVPVDIETTELRFNFIYRTDDERARRSGAAFVDEVEKQLHEDLPIWENKAHLVRPALTDTDGPFMKFRRWYAQFYVEPVEATSDDRYVPAAPADGQPVTVAPTHETAARRLEKATR